MGPPSLVKGALVRRSFSNACKNLGVQHPLGAEIWFSEKVDLGGYNYTSRSAEFLDECSPDFFR